jgi:hypothetical protein
VLARIGRGAGRGPRVQRCGRGGSAQRAEALLGRKGKELTGGPGASAAMWSGGGRCERGRPMWSRGRPMDRARGIGPQGKGGRVRGGEREVGRGLAVGPQKEEREGLRGRRSRPTREEGEKDRPGCGWAGFSSLFHFPFLFLFQTTPFYLISNEI